MHVKSSDIFKFRVHLTVLYLDETQQVHKRTGDEEV